jgi:hypothetical protein
VEWIVLTTGGALVGLIIAGILYAGEHRSWVSWADQVERHLGNLGRLADLMRERPDRRS